MTNNKYYGIRIEYSYGTVHHIGKSMHQLVYRNGTLGEPRIINGDELLFNPLDITLIEKYGYKTKAGAERAIGKVHEALLFECEKIEVVTLDPTLCDVMNWSRVEMLLNKRRFYDE